MLELFLIICCCVNMVEFVISDTLGFNLFLEVLNLSKYLILLGQNVIIFMEQEIS